MRQIACAWIAAVLLAGCTAFAPKTAEEAIGGGYVAVVALAETAKARLEAGMLPVDKAERISARLKESKAGLDTATAALALGDETASKDALAAAIAILTIIERELSQ